MLVNCSTLATAGLIDPTKCCAHCHACRRWVQAACEAVVFGQAVPYEVSVCCRVDPLVLLEDKAAEMVVMLGQPQPQPTFTSPL